MYRKIEDFEKDYNYERESTIKVLKNLTDASLDQRIYPEGRVLGKLATHLTASIAEMLNRTGLKVKGPEHEESVPKHASEILDAYENVSKDALNAIKDGWNDSMLTNEVDMYGSNWSLGTVLSVILFHQTHHRGQMTVLMRQAGLKVPGVYGPSREEWAAFGMPAMA